MKKGEKQVINQNIAGIFRNSNKINGKLWPEKPRSIWINCENTLFWGKTLASCLEFSYLNNVYCLLVGFCVRKISQISEVRKKSWDDWLNDEHDEENRVDGRFSAFSRTLF